MSQKGGWCQFHGGEIIVTGVQKQAYEDYANGMKYADIAAKYNVSISAVKMWVARDWKNNNEKKVTAEKVTKSQPRKKGGQPANTNTVKHGAYKKVFGDTLGEDETGLLDDITTDDIAVLEQTIISLTIRERRLMKRVKQLNEESLANKNLTLGSVTKINGSKGTEFPMDKTITVAEAAFNALRIYEAELTKVQTRKANLAIELRKARKQELNVNKGSHGEPYGDESIREAVRELTLEEARAKLQAIQDMSDEEE